MRWLGEWLVGVCERGAKHAWVGHSLVANISTVSSAVWTTVRLVAALSVRRILTVEWIAHCTRALQASSWRCHEGSRVNCGHPDSGLVDLEQVRDQRIEVDVRVREVVEGKLLPVPVWWLV